MLILVPSQVSRATRNSVGRVQMRQLVDDLLLYRVGKMIPGLFGLVRAVEQEGGTGSGEPKYIDSIKEAELVAGDKACG